MEEKAVVENFAEIFPQDVKHVRGIHYLVRRSAIRFSPTGLTVDGDNLRFGNPRWMRDTEGSLVARGLEIAKMNELRDSIASEGLDTPLRLRVPRAGEPFLEVVNGERRLRSLDRLCSDDTLCYSQESGEMVPAAQLYEWVEAKISYMDDKEAARYSLRPQETGESIGESAALQVLKILRAAGCSDEEIRKITGKSPTWIRDSDSLLGDDSILRALESEEIKRKVALELVKIKDTTERLERLDAVRTNALERIAKKQESLEKAIAQDEAQLEISLAEKRVAELTNDEDQAQEAQQKSENVEKRLKKKEKAKDQIAKKPKTATIKDLAATANENEFRPMSAKKVETEWRTPLAAILRANGKDEEGNDLDIDINDARLVLTVLDALLHGKKRDGKYIRIEDILEEHRDNRTR